MISACRRAPEDVELQALLAESLDEKARARQSF
jgi:hypothetical protein